MSEYDAACHLNNADGDVKECQNLGPEEQRHGKKCKSIRRHLQRQRFLYLRRDLRVRL
jgi:hypothetical protein